MEYTVRKLAGLAGVSTRTLRYYDEIGIFKPARTNSSGYCVYGRAEADRLQQILLHMTQEEYDELTRLADTLLERIQQGGSCRSCKNVC